MDADYIQFYNKTELLLLKLLVLPLNVFWS